MPLLEVVYPKWKGGKAKVRQRTVGSTTSELKKFLKNQREYKKIPFIKQN
jgi:hypothetical protein